MWTDVGKRWSVRSGRWRNCSSSALDRDCQMGCSTAPLLRVVLAGTIRDCHPPVAAGCHSHHRLGDDLAVESLRSKGLHL